MLDTCVVCFCPTALAVLSNGWGANGMKQRDAELRRERAKLTEYPGEKEACGCVRFSRGSPVYARCIHIRALRWKA